MKNIHLIPTNEPSKLVKLSMFGLTKLHSCENILPIQDEEQYQNLYITNEEYLKDDEHCISFGSDICKGQLDTFCSGVKYSRKPLKIVLTTDLKLIADGIQKIDDTFLEWFCKNSGCESVKVEVMNKGYNKPEDKPYQECYKIIIPQKESEMTECYFIPNKQNSSATICNNCGQEKMLHTIGEGIKSIRHIVNQKSEIDWSGFPQSTKDEVGYVKPKKESIEDPANEITISEKRFKEALLDAAKWEDKLSNYEKEQVVFNIARERVVNRIFEEYKGETPQKRMFSEEELKNAFFSGCQSEREIKPRIKCWKEWYENFKKK